MTTAAEKAVQRLEKAVTVREKELAQALEGERSAAEAFDVDGTPANLDAASKSRIVRESAERKLTSERQALDLALAELRKEQRATALAEHEQRLATLATWGDALAPIFAKLADVDATLFQLALDAAGVVATAQAAHDLAADRAKALGLTVALARPSLDEVQLLAQRHVDASREADGRDAVSDWVAPPARDWRSRTMSAAEISEGQAHAARETERAQHTERAQRDALAAVVGANAAAAAPKGTPTTTSNGA
jgi:hypothetical protein